MVNNTRLLKDNTLLRVSISSKADTDNRRQDSIPHMVVILLREVIVHLSNLLMVVTKLLPKDTVHPRPVNTARLLPSSRTVNRDTMAHPLLSNMVHPHHSSTVLLQQDPRPQHHLVMVRLKSLIGMGIQMLRLYERQ